LSKKRFQDISTSLTTIATIVAGLAATGTGVGAIWNLYLLAQSQVSKMEIENRSNLSNYSSYAKYLSNYQSIIQPAISRILKKKWNELQCQEILQKTSSKTGMEVFGSEEYKDFRIAHNFYESLGFSLKNKVINFDIIFDLFTYPAYWALDEEEWYLSKNPEDWLKGNFSTLRPMRECIGDNYFGKGKELRDFSDNIDQLGYNYLYARLQGKFNRDCHQKSSAPKTCTLLSKRIQDFKTGKNGKEVWKKLY
jgi:hypothetical protein